MDAVLAERDNRIKELKEELAESRRQVLILHNQITWRSTGVALDPNLLPEEYRPKVMPQPAKSANPLEDDPKPQGRVGNGPMAIRERLRKVEKEKEEEFLNLQGKPSRSAQMEVLDIINKDAQEVLAKVKGA
jgi:hypothetical protein